MRSHASRIWSACAVSMTSDEVIPKCSQRADGPTFSATAVVNAMTSCCVVCSISSMRATSKRAALADVARGLGGHDAGGRHRLGGGRLDQQPGFVPTLVAPDATHLGVGVACDHESGDARFMRRTRQSTSSRSRGIFKPFTLPSTVAASEPFLKRSAATRCTSFAVTRSMPCSVSSRPNWRSK